METFRVNVELPRQLQIDILRLKIGLGHKFQDDTVAVAIRYCCEHYQDVMKFAKEREVSGAGTNNQG